MTLIRGFDHARIPSCRQGLKSSRQSKYGALPRGRIGPVGRNLLPMGKMLSQWKSLLAARFHVKHQRTAVAPGNRQDNKAARTASMACGRGKVTRQTKPTVRDGCVP